ncbi:MAG: hypothetical protein GY771_00520 [bacterium]|nr:hypothetical protein [bacterium]
MVEDKTNEGKPRGCLPAIIVFAVIVIVAVVGISLWSVSTPGGAVFISVLRGERGLEDLTTKLIMDSVMKESEVPDAEYRELEKRMGDIKPAVNAMDEGEKREFANKIRAAAEDGHLSEDEIDDIVSYMKQFDGMEGD